MTNYATEVASLKKEKNLTDYEMQLFLHKKGIKLYDEEIDNCVDNELLAKYAKELGFDWNEEKEVWERKNIFKKIVDILN